MAIGAGWNNHGFISPAGNRIILWSKGTTAWRRQQTAKMEVVMNFSESRVLGVSLAFASAVSLAGAASAADISNESVKVAPGVVKAMEGYETPPNSYVDANPTDIYNDHYFYNTKVTGALKRGEKVDVLAKVKGWDWVLVGRNGTGIGYVAISMLSPSDKYIP